MTRCVKFWPRWSPEMEPPAKRPILHLSNAVGVGCAFYGPSKLTSLWLQILIFWGETPGQGQQHWVRTQESGCHVWTPLLIHRDATANCTLPNSEVYSTRVFYTYFSDRVVRLAHQVVYYLKRNGDDDVFVGKAGSRGHDWLVSEQWGGNMLSSVKIYAMRQYLAPST